MSFRDGTVDTHDASLAETICNDWSSIGTQVTKIHSRLVVVHGVVDTAHQTLIITEEKNGQGSHTIDGPKKTTLLQPVHDIVLWDDIHIEV